MTTAQDLITRLKDPSLVREATWIGGAWVDAEPSGFAVENPSTGTVLARVPDIGLDGFREAIDAAYEAQKPWATSGAKHRSAVLRRWHDLIMANLEDLSAILTAELGKPLAEARGEVLYGAGYVEWYAEEAKRMNGDILPGHQPDKRLLVLRQPIGVAAGITPWNFPVAMPLRKIAPALAAGCAMVLKPANLTPLSSIALAVLAERAGVPAGVLSIVTTTSSAAFGSEVCSNDKVRKLTFTGSTGVGRQLMRQAAENILKLSLELGGNAPFIVFNDADLDAAVEGAILSKFRNAGQTCVCANRMYIQAGVYDAFAHALAQRVAAMKVGDGFESGVDIGPMINRAAAEKVEFHIADAMQKGARLLVGGPSSEPDSLFVCPTVLADAHAGMAVAREETFGPMAPLFRFHDEDDVIRQANDTEFGLAAYFYANDLRRVWRVAEALEYGMVGINTGLISTEIAPFGGIKQSGLGREGSRYGLEEFTELKYLCLGAMA